MSYDQELLRLARREQERRVFAYRKERSLQRERLYQREPALRELDMDIRDVFMDALSRFHPEAFSQASVVSLSLQEQRAALLTSLGARSDALDDLPLCPLCNDKGRRGAEPCACVLTHYRRLQARNLSSLLDLNYQSFESFDSSRFSTVYNADYGGTPRENIDAICDLCRNFCESFNEQSDNLVFTGVPGTGKTFMAACIAGAVANRGYSVVYDTASRQLRNEEALHFGRGGHEEELQSLRLRSCDLLIIDDLGAEFLTPFTQAALLDLINLRVLERKKMIVSTNLTKKDLSPRYSDALKSRLCGQFLWLQFFGDDLRVIDV